MMSSIYGTLETIDPEIPIENDNENVDNDGNFNYVFDTMAHGGRAFIDIAMVPPLVKKIKISINAPGGAGGVLSVGTTHGSAPGGGAGGYGEFTITLNDMSNIFFDVYIPKDSSGIEGDGGSTQYSQANVIVDVKLITVENPVPIIICRLYATPGETPQSMSYGLNGYSGYEMMPDWTAADKVIATNVELTKREFVITKSNADYTDADDGEPADLADTTDNNGFEIYRKNYQAKCGGTVNRSALYGDMETYVHGCGGNGQNAVSDAPLMASSMTLGGVGVVTFLFIY